MRSPRASRFDPATARLDARAALSECGDMKRFLVRKIRDFGLAVARLFASDLVDVRTGKKIGRALLLPWRGKIHVIGLDAAVQAVFLPQERLTFWKQEIGFTAQPPPDFPHEPRP
jgi:hypothetical protein